MQFTCLEELAEKNTMVYMLTAVGRQKAVVKNTYLYDFQIITINNRFEETRILLSENGKKRREKNATLKLKYIDYKFFIMGPIGILEKENQGHFDYDFMKETLYRSDRVSIVKFGSKPGNENDPSRGKVWISQKDGSVSRIEWEQKSIRNYDNIRETASKLKAEPKINVIFEYEYEKNGIKFPSRGYYKEQYLFSNGDSVTLTEVEIVYKSYKFFTVETKIDLKYHGRNSEPRIAPG